jgi:catechol 2,3-dioxygenase-like lactoylglutathione lyase family enzyme
VRVSCRSAADSAAWYERVLGLEDRGERPTGRGSAGAWSAYRLWPKGQDAFAIDLVEWESAAASGAPYEVANHLGIYRAAFLVEDMREAHAALAAAGAACPEPVWLDMGPEIPIDGLWACFFPDPDGSCLELIESPKL